VTAATRKNTFAAWVTEPFWARVVIRVRREFLFKVLGNPVCLILKRTRVTRVFAGFFLELRTKTTSVNVKLKGRADFLSPFSMRAQRRPLGENKRACQKLFRSPVRRVEKRSQARWSGAGGVKDQEIDKILAREAREKTRRDLR
jgi:hypothetical protein